MTDNIKEADNALLRLWEKLDREGLRPITYQFPKAYKKGDVLTNIRSGLQSYLQDSNNFNTDGSLKDKNNVFSHYLSVEQPAKKIVGAIDSINFAIEYTPEKGLQLINFYVFRLHKTKELTLIDIKHKPNEPPPVKDLNILLEKTDKERIRKNERGMNKRVDFTRAKRNRMKV
jgi:hypothetical protein